VNVDPRLRELPLPAGPEELRDLVERRLERGKALARDLGFRVIGTMLGTGRPVRLILMSRAGVASRVEVVGFEGRTSGGALRWVE
jgi:hypothetical protein